MDKKQESKIKMSRAVSGILEGFEDIVKKIPTLNESHIKLDQLIEDTEKFSQGQLNKGTEHTEQKDNARENLINEGIKICAALAAFATSSTDVSVKPLKTKYKIKDTVIRRLRDMQLFTYSYQIYSDALPNADKLEPFATAAEVKGLKEKADIFNGLLPKRRTQLNSSVRSTQNLAKTLESIDALLNDTIDVLIKPLEFKEVDFYNSYKSARDIVEASYRRNKKTDEKPNTPIDPNVE